MSRKSEAVDAAVALTMRLNKYLHKEDPANVVMSCAALIGMALAEVPPGRPRKEVRASVNGIIKDIIKEYEL